MGFTVQAMVGINADGDLRSIGAELGKLPQIDYVVVASGRYDLLVEVVCENSKDLFDLVNDVIRSTPGVRSAEVFTYLDLVKQTYTWGTR